MTEPLFLNSSSVALLLDCTAESIRRLQRLGLMPAPVKIGACQRWRRAEILAWVAAACPPRAAWESMRQVEKK